MPKKFIMMLGPQGSGKSTQAKLLAGKLNYLFISSGDLLRTLKEENNPIGVKLAEYWMKGELVPDNLITDILFGVFEKENTLGFVLDGFPRDLDQLESFLAEAGLKDWTLDKVFYLQLTDEEALERIKKRKEIENRPDETKKALEKRFTLYHEKTEKLLSKYSEMGKLVVIDGSKSVEEIHNVIISHTQNNSPSIPI